jgi:putative ABC transport system permease protein
VLAGHWILSLLTRVGARLGLASRIATRDAAANPSRVVPAFGAIAACVFIASFALTAVGVWSASAATTWTYSSPLGTVHVDVLTNYDGAGEIEDIATAALAVTEPDATAIVRGQAPTYETNEQGLAVGEAATLFTPQLMHYVDCDTIENGPCNQRASALLTAGAVYVIDEAGLDTALGTTVPDAALRTFENGGAIVADPNFISAGKVTINEWDLELVDTYWQNYDPSRPLDPLGSWTLTAAGIDLPHPLLWLDVVISPETAADLGMATVPLHVIGAYDTPPTQQSLDALAEVVAQPWSSIGGLTYAMENGPPDTAPWLLLIIGTAGVLVLGAAAVTLGLARYERRPDDATLTAVGAPRRLRRGIAFWQGIVIVGVGAVTGTLAGLIPMWGITLMQPDEQNIIDAPWPWLAGLALGLPIAIAAVNWLVPPRHPDLTRRTAIA